MSDPIARHGGEILKFISDGLLAIFRSAGRRPAQICCRGRSPSGYGCTERKEQRNRAPLNHGIGVHLGDVMYGNIGSRTRLDFTVIGPAVNMASRLETLTSQLGRT